MKYNSMEFIEIEGIRIAVQRKNIKNIYLRVRAENGEVKVSAPVSVNRDRIFQFIHSKLPWIRRHLASGKEKELPKEINYMTGDTVWLWGQKYRLLVFSKGSGSKVCVQGEEIILNVSSDSTAEEREKIWQDFCRAELKKRIPDLISKWEPVMGVQVCQWNVKKMRTRWGSCNIDKKRIWLSLMLAQKPEECLEEVVVHEMVHLLEAGHNKRFYGYMDRFLPQWRIWNQWLKQRR